MGVGWEGGRGFGQAAAITSCSSDYIMQYNYKGIGEAVPGPCRTESMVITSLLKCARGLSAVMERYAGFNSTGT